MPTNEDLEELYKLRCCEMGLPYPIPMSDRNYEDEILYKQMEKECEEEEERIFKAKWAKMTHKQKVAYRLKQRKKILEYKYKKYDPSDLPF